MLAKVAWLEHSWTRDGNLAERAKHTGRCRAALIVAGAAAKGPFAAGAFTRLASDDRFQITSVAGASSGALNGAVYAAGLRVNQAARAADGLAKRWVSQACVPGILPWKNRKAIVREALEEFRRAPTQQAVRFRVVLASLSGERDRFRRVRFEHSESFVSEDFQDERRLDHMAELCVASAALPVLFEPREVAAAGPFWDGGIVDNAPIGWALKDETIDHVVVIAPDVNNPKKGRYGRFAVGRLLHLLIDERLSRDLYEAESFNEELVRLRDHLGELRATTDERFADEVLRYMRWRIVRFVEIRPTCELEGNVLSGFVSKSLRKAYVMAGRAAAERALSALVEPERPWAAPHLAAV